MTTHSDVEKARQRISASVRRTPIVDLDPELVPGAASVRLKLEQLQHTGSFKARGAYNRVVSALAEGRIGEAGVVAASGGNAGMAVAHAASRHGVPARVYVPANAPAFKQAKLRELGAEVVAVGEVYADAHRAAVKDIEENGAVFCHAYDQPAMCAGNGTLGTELLEQTEGELDTVLLAVGGGGLMAGVAAALESRARVVGVEPTDIPTLHTALAEGGPTDVAVSGVAKDSLGATRLGEIAYEVATRTGVRSVLVDDEHIVAARKYLWQRYRLVVEHGTAAALGALFAGAYRPTEGERLAVVLCGANTDLTDLG
ncbi:threonine dehydratase [Actinopolyspora lacussalsi subsp. righensis]|uniref:threonine ammonia-lyase n=1 Tax=Actinopolyspora righensis TaxID=995060 RepID=A0A1I6XZZ0_9ACTN|nr:threonine/serine dehydratase [Actinopolyspora righensis]SFT43673.1 threonine dehydratase [Actinopolyspora righensis]